MSRAFCGIFVRDPYGETPFIGLVAAKYIGPSTQADPKKYDLYRVTRRGEFSELEGKLVVDWGRGDKS